MNARQQRLGIWREVIVLTMLLGALNSTAKAEPGDEESGGLLKLSLPDCIRKAIEDHPSVQEVQWDVAIRKSDLQEAEAGYLPTGEFANLFGFVNDVKGSLGGQVKTWRR